MLVMVSPIAMRPDAGPSINANGVRSPIAIASPVVESKPDVVTAQLATGTCQGPTICSRATIPVIERSPMVIRKAFAGNCRQINTLCVLQLNQHETSPEPAVQRLAAAHPGAFWGACQTTQTWADQRAAHQTECIT